MRKRFLNFAQNEKEEKMEIHLPSKFLEFFLRSSDHPSRCMILKSIDDIEIFFLTSHRLIIEYNLSF